MSCAVLLSRYLSLYCAALVHCSAGLSHSQHNSLTALLLTVAVYQAVPGGTLAPCSFLAHTGSCIMYASVLYGLLGLCLLVGADTDNFCRGNPHMHFQLSMS